jgi:hypothetical protein
MKHGSDLHRSSWPKKSRCFGLLHLIKGRSNPYPYPVLGCERHPSLDMVLDPGMASGTTLAKTPCQLWQSSVPAFPSVAANPGLSICRRNQTFPSPTLSETTGTESCHEADLHRQPEAKTSFSESTTPRNLFYVVVSDAVSRSGFTSPYLYRFLDQG